MTAGSTAVPTTGRAIAVVGAGILGCLIASELAAADPRAVITVFDRDLVGSGTTRKSAGLFLARGASATTRSMSAFSYAYYAQLLISNPRLPIYPVDATVITDGATDPVTFGYLPDLAKPTQAPHLGKRADTGALSEPPVAVPDLVRLPDDGR